MAQSKAALKALRKKYGLGEFKNLKKPKRPAKTRGFSSMAKRHRKSSGGIGGSNIKGLVESFFIGAGAATIQEKIAPQVIPYQSMAVAAVAGYMGKKNIANAGAAVAGALARNMLQVSPTGIGISTQSVTGY